MKKNRTQRIILLGLVTLIISFLIVATILMLHPTNVGVVIDRDADENLIYGNHNLQLLKALVISAIVLSSLVLVTYFVPALLQILPSKNEEVSKSRYEQILKSGERDLTKTVQTIFTIVGIVLSSLLIAFHSYILAVFPVAQDKRNNYSWALAFASIIILIGILIYSIYYLVNINKEQSSKTTFSIQILTEGSMMVGLSVILSVISDLIPGFKFPAGGSFSLSMLPLFIFALRRGMAPGALVGLAYSIVNFLIDGGSGALPHWATFFVDYLFPYTGLAFIAGIFSKKAKDGLFVYSLIGIFLGGFFRYIMHGISGVVFFAEYAPAGVNLYYYSFIIYNLPYMAVNTVVCMIFVYILHSRLITLDSRVV